MMIHAYNELYLNDAIKNLSNAFDYAINVCKQEPNWFAKLFVQSGIAEQFERGNPAIISGKSGEELVLSILNTVYPNDSFPMPTYSEGRTPEYWAGWALAQYQWMTSKRFKDIFNLIPLDEIISMYPIFHEMDISRFNESMEQKWSERKINTNLQEIRKNCGYSQSELARQSGVSLRSIQLYEQKVNDIDKAQAHTLYKLAKSLGCNIEDLLENPKSL